MSLRKKIQIWLNKKEEDFYAEETLQMLEEIRKKDALLANKLKRAFDECYQGVDLQVLIYAYIKTKNWPEKPVLEESKEPKTTLDKGSLV